MSEQENTFGWALQKLKEGHIVTRTAPDYANRDARMVLAQVEALKQTLILLVIGAEDQYSFHFWQPQSQDLLAEDYELYIPPSKRLIKPVPPGTKIKPM